MQSLGDAAVRALPQDVQQLEDVLRVIFIGDQFCYFLQLYTHIRNNNPANNIIFITPLPSLSTTTPFPQNFSFRYLNLHEMRLSSTLSLRRPASELSSSVQSENVLSFVAEVSWLGTFLLLIGFYFS